MVPSESYYEEEKKPRFLRAPKGSLDLCGATEVRPCNSCIIQIRTKFSYNQEIPPNRLGVTLLVDNLSLVMCESHAHETKPNQGSLLSHFSLSLSASTSPKNTSVSLSSVPNASNFISPSFPPPPLLFFFYDVPISSLSNLPLKPGGPLAR